MDLDGAVKAIESAGYTVASANQIENDIGHDKFAVRISGKEFGNHEVSYHATFQSDLEQHRGGRQVESLFGGEISPGREAAIYTLARHNGIPALDMKVIPGDPDFLLQEMPVGCDLKSYVVGIDAKEDRASIYLKAVRNVGALLARAHSVEFGRYGDVTGAPGRAFVVNGRSDYTDRLNDIVSHNLAWNPHEVLFTSEELAEVRNYLRSMLDKTDFEGIASPSFVLANLHRGNVYVDDETGTEIIGTDGFNFAQAAPPVAEFYNAFWQFADPTIVTAQEAHNALLEGYWQEGGRFNPNSPTNQAVMDILTVNHFLRAATLYAAKPDDPMRNRWGERFKDEILLPTVRGDVISHDHFGTIINEKWKKFEEELKADEQ